MSAPVLLNLLNELGKRDKMRGLCDIVIYLDILFIVHNVVSMRRR